MMILKKSQGTPNSQNIPEKRTRGLTLPDFNAYYKTTAIQIVWCRYKNRQVDQIRNRLLSPEINPQVCGQMIFNKGTKTAQ